ncbi:hypothetical protein LTR53_001658 [Teratosphaeriaceae sp. CCFEE 6253]|nr:hypothetical protein LTR53_001658 [Teratosphaeriaceae sp. CCFEE 6253]
MSTPQPGIDYRNFQAPDARTGGGGIRTSARYSDGVVVEFLQKSLAVAAIGSVMVMFVVYRVTDPAVLDKLPFIINAIKGKCPIATPNPNLIYAFLDRDNPEIRVLSAALVATVPATVSMLGFVKATATMSSGMVWLGTGGAILATLGAFGVAGAGSVIIWRWWYGTGTGDDGGAVSRG